MARTTFRTCWLTIVAAAVVGGLPGCGLRPVTHYLESPVSFARSEPMKRAAQECRPKAAIVETLRERLGKDGAYGTLPFLIYAPERDWNEAERVQHIASMMQTIEPLVEMVACQERGIVELGIDRLREDHSGLRLTESADVPGARQRIFADALPGLPGPSDRLSASFRRPASLAMSARQLEDVSAPATAFGKLSERAQASLFTLGGAVSTQGGDKTPAEVVKDVLGAVAPQADPTFSESQRVELTISAAVNTGGTDDRLEYVSAYVSIPAIPAVTTRGLHFEEEFLRRLQALTLGHHGVNRPELLAVDARRALGRVTIWFNEIEKPQITAQALDLGTLSSTGGVGLELSGTPTGASAAKGTAKLEATRTDKLLKEIERRSTWIDERRTMLRVTQRGHEDVTVAGTVVQNLSLHIPRSPRLLMQVVDDKGDKQALSVSNVFQPLYPKVTGLGFVVAVVRVASPTRNPWVAGPSGYAMTVVEGPVWISVWEASTTTDRLSVADLFPEADARVGKWAVVLKTADTTDAAQFGSAKDRLKFVDALARTGRKGEFGLQKVNLKGFPDHRWLKIVPCTKLKVDSDGWKDEIDKKSLDGTDYLLGLEDPTGRIRGFRADEMKPEPVGCRQP
jgi:hypothetical protein